LKDKIDLETEELGAQLFKNIPRPVHAYNVPVDFLLYNAPVNPAMGQSKIDDGADANAPSNCGS